MEKKKTTQRKEKQGLIEIKRIIGRKLDGNAIAKSFYGKTKREAVLKYNDYMEAKRSGIEPNTHETFSSWALKWLDTTIKGTVKSNTYYNNYEIPVRLHLIPYFGSAEFPNLRPLDIQAFLNEKSKTLAIGTLQKLRTCLYGICSTAAENGLCSSNPVTENVKVKTQAYNHENQIVSAKQTESTATKRAYTREQFSLVENYAKEHRFGLGILVMLYTGISRSELLGLQRGDLNSDGSLAVQRGVVEVKNQFSEKYEVVVSDGLKNAYRRREIPLPEWLFQSLKNIPETVLIAAKPKEPMPTTKITKFLFRDSLGNAWNPNNWTKRVFNVFMKEMHEYYLQESNGSIDVPALHPHEMRHTAATRWALTGVDLYTIARLGGWTDLKMVAKVYGHTDTQVMREHLGYAPVKA